MRDIILRDHERYTRLSDWEIHHDEDGHLRTDEERTQFQQTHRDKQIAWFIAQSGVPIRLREATLDTVDVTNDEVGKMVDRSRVYLNGKEWETGRGLYLSGLPGVGKTHIAAAIICELIRRRIERCVFWEVPELLDEVRSFFDRNENDRPEKNPIEEPMKCRVLVLDDIGTERATEWVRETLYRIVDYRYANLLPTIYTTNHDLTQLRDILEPQFTGEGQLGKITGRIYQTCAPPVWTDAPDYRRAH